MKFVWPILRLAPARAVKVSTIGMLRQPLRRRFGLSWGRRDAFDMRLLMRTSRALTPVLPKSLMKDFGYRHLEWRRKEIAGGPLGPAADGSGGCPISHASAA